MAETPEKTVAAPLPEVRRRMNDGAQLIAEGRSREALALFQQTALLQPDYPDAPLMAGVALFLGGDAAAAKEQLELANRMAPDRADVLQNLGLVRGALGDVNGEIAAYEASLDR